MSRLRLLFAVCCLLAWLVVVPGVDAAVGAQVNLLLTPRAPRPTGTGTAQAVGAGAVRVTLAGAAAGQRLDAFACKRKEVTDFRFLNCSRIGRPTTSAAGALDQTFALPKVHPRAVWVVLNQPGARSLYAARIDTLVRTAE